MSDPVLVHRRCPLRNLDSRTEVLAAWLIILGRLTVFIGDRLAILGAGDILK
jgi:hypothetical protein